MVDFFYRHVILRGGTTTKVMISSPHIDFPIKIAGNNFLFSVIVPDFLSLLSRTLARKQLAKIPWEKKTPFSRPPPQKKKTSSARVTWKKCQQRLHENQDPCLSTGSLFKQVLEKIHPKTIPFQPKQGSFGFQVYMVPCPVLPPPPPPPPWYGSPPPPPIPHAFCTRHCSETYISILLHARRCSETHIFILLDEPSRRIRWVDRAKLWRNANFKLQEWLRAVYRTLQCSANGIIYIYISMYIHIHKHQ